MSDSVRPHRWQPTRLPHPWDSPGKNTGVGCHFLLQRMKVKSESEVTQSCLTLSDPLDCSLPGSSVHGIFQARVLKWFSRYSIAFRVCVAHSPKTWPLSLLWVKCILFPEELTSKFLENRCPSSKYWRRQWHPTPVLLPGKSHGRRSLVGCSPWGC